MDKDLGHHAGDVSFLVLHTERFGKYFSIHTLCSVLYIPTTLSVLNSEQ